MKKTEKPIPTLKSIQRRFKYWRKTRKASDTIPEKLWEAALTLTNEYSVNQIAKSLKLDYADLQERVVKGDIRQNRKSEKIKENSFIEIDLKNQLFPQPQKAGCSIEVTDNRGWKIKFSGHNITELFQASEQIWRGDFK